MPLPKKKLELSLDVDALTLDDWCALEKFSFNAFRQFLFDYSNWTKADVSKLTRAEIFATWGEVQELVGKAIEPPLGSKAPSEPGREATQTASPSK